MPRESSRGRKSCARRQAEPLQQRVDALVDAVVDHAVRERDELEVLAHRQVVVEHRRVGHQRERGPRLLGLGLAVRIVAARRGRVPSLGSSRPAIARTAVDLPLPLAPISATHSPAATVRVRLSSATSRP